MSIEELIAALTVIKSDCEESPELLVSTDGYYLAVKRVLHYPEKVIILLDDGVTKIGKSES